jgi:hypothetical protein
MLSESLDVHDITCRVWHDAIMKTVGSVILFSYRIFYSIYRMLTSLARPGDRANYRVRATVEALEEGVASVWPCTNNCNPMWLLQGASRWSQALGLPECRRQDFASGTVVGVESEGDLNAIHHTNSVYAYICNLNPRHRMPRSVRSA